MTDVDATIEPGQHAVLVKPNHDERARQELCREMRAHLLTEVQDSTKKLFETKVHPAFRVANRREMQDRHEVRHAMADEPLYRLYCASLRTTQELMWDSVVDTVERESERLQIARKNITMNLGSLKLNPSLQIPRYHTAADIHLQPGGYHTEFAPDDLSAGATYDRALQIYGNGKYGAYNEIMGQMVVTFLKGQYLNFKPSKILDMGCTVGNSTLPYVDAFPSAEVHAIDVSAPCLRYGHARAESLGNAVHFAQMNAEKTEYDNECFDLVVSHLLFHETSRTALTNILSECHRLLTPGGLMVHLDIPQDRHCDDLYKSFIWDWEAYNNNETFEVVLRSLDYEAEAIGVGFECDKVRIETAPINWPMLVAQKAR